MFFHALSDRPPIIVVAVITIVTVIRKVLSLFCQKESSEVSEPYLVTMHLTA